MRVLSGQQIHSVVSKSNNRSIYCQACTTVYVYYIATAVATTASLQNYLAFFSKQKQKLLNVDQQITYSVKNDP